MDAAGASHEAITKALDEAIEYGLSNVSFEVLDVAKLPADPAIDAVFAFDTIRDQIDPVGCWLVPDNPFNAFMSPVKHRSIRRLREGGGAGHCPINSACPRRVTSPPGQPSGRGSMPSTSCSTTAWPGWVEVAGGSLTRKDRLAGVDRLPP